MEPATASAVATGVAAGGSMLTSGISAHKNRKLAREQMRFNAQQADKANQFNAQQAALSRQWQEDFYNKYQSPSAMMRQKLEAGYNPYGEFGNPQAPVSAPTYSDANVPSDNSFNTASNANSAEAEQLMTSLQQMSSVFREVLSLRQMKAEIEKTENETNQLKQRYFIDSFQSRVMNMELEESDLLGFDHYGIGSKWYQDFLSKFHRKPTFGDLHWQAYHKKTAREINRANGLGSHDAQDPIIGAFREFMSGVGSDQGDSLDFTDPDGYINRLYRGDSNQLYIDDKDKGELLNRLLYEFASGHFNSKNEFERSSIETFVKAFKKNRLENGLPEDSNSMLNTFLNLLYHQDPGFIKKHLGNMTSVLDELMTHGEGSFDALEQPLNSISTLISDDMGKVLNELYNGLSKASKVGSIIYKGAKKDIKRKLGR